MMNREEGWFKVFRSMFNNPVVMKDADHLALWIYLLGQASHKPHDTVFGGKRITLQPGQLITGRKKLAGVLKIDPSKVKRILKEFKNEHQIDQQSERYGSLISIVNWSPYQQDDQQSDQRATNERPTSDQRVTTIQECKNDKNGKNERNNVCVSPTPTHPRKMVPPTMEMLQEYAAERKKIGKPYVDIEKFYDFYESKGWKVGRERMKDWQAAYRNWERDRNFSGKQKPRNEVKQLLLEDMLSEQN